MEDNDTSTYDLLKNMPDIFKGIKNLIDSYPEAENAFKKEIAKKIGKDENDKEVDEVYDAMISLIKKY